MALGTRMSIYLERDNPGRSEGGGYWGGGG